MNELYTRVQTVCTLSGRENMGEEISRSRIQSFFTFVYCTKIAIFLFNTKNHMVFVPWTPAAALPAGGGSCSLLGHFRSAGRTSGLQGGSRLRAWPSFLQTKYPRVKTNFMPTSHCTCRGVLSLRGRRLDTCDTADATVRTPWVNLA